MTRTLRGLWARRQALAPVAALSTALVASVTVCLVRAGREGDPDLVAPLVVLGCVALVAPARALAADRRTEAALARLRGLGGLRLLGHLLVEPLLAVLAGGLVGLGVAGAFVPPAPTGLVVLAGTLVASAAATGVALAVGLREPLSLQVSRLARPRPASAAATFAGLLALAASGYAVFAAGQEPAGPGWLVDAAPALVGLAVGQLLVWLLRGTARLAVARSTSASAGPFLAFRRLARRTGTVTPLALVVAAAVTATVAGTGAVSARDWVDQAARLEVAAPLQVPLEGVAAAQVVDLTHRLDPRGRWLEAAVVLPRGEDGRRTVLLDTERYARVSAALLRETDAAPVAARVAGLGRGAVTPGRGDSVVLAGRVSGRMPRAVRLGLDYVTDQNYVATRTVRVRPEPDGSVAARVHVDGCAHGCVPTGATVGAVGRSGGSSSLSLRTLELAGVDLRQVFGLTGSLPLTGPATTHRPVLADSPAPVIASGGPARRVQAPDGSERPAATVARVPALPLAGARGTLADLRRTLAGSLPTSPSARVLVLARANTPARVLARLPGKPETLAQVHARVDAASGAARTRTALLAGLCCLLVAAITLFAGTTRQRQELAHETASLRVVGLSLGQLRPSVRVELLACGLAALAAVGLGSWVAGALLLRELPLLTVPGDALAPDVGVRPVVLVAGALVALLLVVAVAGRGRVVRETASRPALLREEGVE
jgi:hypothetical protein